MAIKRRAKMGFFTKVLVVVSGVFAAVQLVSLHMKIADKEAELSSLQQKVKEQTVANKELERLIAMGDDEEYQKRIAMEQLDFAYSDEKIYVDISGN